MEEAYEHVLAQLTAGCSEAEFEAMRCPRCDGRLTISVNPDGRTFFVRCIADSTHLAMHGESHTPPEWWQRRIKSLGWY